MVVNADATSRDGTLSPAGTFVAGGQQAGPLQGSDYQAALQAAGQGADGYVYTCLNSCVLLASTVVVPLSV